MFLLIHRQKSFLLTFDDGLKETYYNADPVLEALNYTAVIFVITRQSIEKEDHSYYLNKKELHQMQDSNRWEIESHGYVGHVKIPIGPNGEQGSFYGNKRWLDEEQRMETDEEYKKRVENDLRISKNMIEIEFNKEVIAFAPPFGDVGQKATNYLQAGRV